MANWVAEIYNTLKEAETAIEAIADSKEIHATAFKEGALQKVLVAQGSSYLPEAIADVCTGLLITTIATLASQTSFTLTAGSADDDAYNGMVAVIEDASTATQKAIGVISNYVGGTKTITLREDPGIFTMAVTDKIYIKAGSLDIPNILADTNELQTDWVDGGRLDLLLDACSTHTPANVRQSVCVTGDPTGSIGKLLFDNLNAPIGSIPTTPTLQDTWTDAKAAFLDENISAAKTLTTATIDAIRKSVCLTGDTANSIGKALYELYIIRLTATRAGYLDELDFDLDAREQDISFMDNVYIDTTLGAANTTYPTGTATHPVSNIANALTIAVARNLKHLHIHGTFASVTETISGYWLLGNIGPLGSPFITLAAGVANAGTIFNHCMITGTANGWAVYENDCVLISLAGVQGLIRGSDLSGTIKLGSGITDFNKCSTIAGAITLDLDDIASGTVHFHEFLGSMNVTNLDTAGSVKIYSCSGSNITIAVSCDAGTIDVYGSGTVTDNSAGGCTVTDHMIEAGIAATETKVDTAITDIGTAITDIGTVDGYHDVPGEDATADAQMRDVMGKKTDTVAGTSIVSISKQVKAKTDNLPADPATEAKQDTIDTVVDAIIAETDKIPVTEIEVESVYVATAPAPLTANAEYPLLEVLVSGSVIYIYRYNHTSGNVPAAPDEATGRTEITHFDGDVFELSKLFVNVNKAATGLWTKMGATDKAYLYAKYYDTTTSAFVLVPDIVLRDKAADTLITAPPVDTDLGEAVVFDSAKLQLASRFIVYFYNDTNIASQVDVPFTLAVRRAR